MESKSTITFCCFPISQNEYKKPEYGSFERSERRTDKEINDTFFKIIKTSPMNIQRGQNEHYKKHS